jgi:hypothetical protein
MKVRFVKVMLVGAIALLSFAGRSLAYAPRSEPAAMPTAMMMAEWEGDSNAITPGSGGTFKPDRNFGYIHVQEIDVALNGPLAPGEVICFQFIATYDDGSVATSGPCIFLGAPQQFDMVPIAFWSSAIVKGKCLTSFAYQVSSFNGPSAGSSATAMIEAFGSETTK